MSGLALVARALGRRRCPAPIAPSPPTASACAPPGSSRRSDTMRGAPAGGAEVVVSTAIAADNPELAAGARRRGARAPSRRPAGRGRRAQALDRRRRHPWQDHHREHGRARAGGARARPGLPDRRRAAHDRHERRVGAGRADRGRGRRVRPLVPEARARLRRGDERRARPPLDLPLDARGRARPSRSSPSAAEPWRRWARRRCRIAGETFGIEAGALAARDAARSTDGSRFGVEGTAVQLRVPGAHNVLNALARARGLRAAGVPLADAAPALARLRRRPAALRAPRPDAPRAPRSTTTTPTTRPRSRPRSRPRAR